ncbi:class I SAM-dependent methyltransferase [Luteimonas arsenica]|uniref:class I SAM-dependent methyltransferase n=1 Tax=Luteimonas arsenica TaxID=1586242 RepID=UPI001054498D|nr:SAM-dependent methyltransferase [Luteimonas arsenica]
MPLPPLDPEAQAHSDRLRQLIHAVIADAGGAIPFSRFMELALYAPGLGYYSAGSTKFGRAGDFVTAPELGSLFAECVAEALAPPLRQVGDRATFVEIGGGSGAFAEAAIRHLAALDAMPACYAILEPSADLRERQRERLRERLPAALNARVEWLDRPLGEDDWSGVLFANEVIDALPTPRFVIRGGEVMEEGVASAADGGFTVVEVPSDALMTAAVRHVERERGEAFPEGYRSELLPQLPYWIQAVMGRMQAGAMLFIDYGYPRREYYARTRDRGTLRAFHRHHVVDDVFARVGLQDITASVDFTALAEAGTGAGFDFAGYCSQAAFLLGNGLEQRLAAQEAIASTETARFALRREVQQLTLPTAMGERFQAMGFERGVPFEAAFLAGDLSFRL